MSILIAGSGPAGVFAALGALEQGANVVMIDPGRTLEDSAQARKAQMGAKHFSQWSDEEEAWLRNPVQPAGQRIIFGSDFSTRTSGAPRMEGCQLFLSQAQGGLSNAWGRGVEPPYAGEYDHWPCKEEFEQAMAQALAHLPFCAAHDNLARVMPLWHEAPGRNKVSAASRLLLRQWHRYAQALNQSGVYFGRSRILQRQGSIAARGCQFCGYCYYGCVYDALYDSSHTLQMLTQRYASQFTYRSGVSLQQFRADNGGKVLASIISHTPHSVSEETYDGVILAAGSVFSTDIMMRSLSISHAQLQQSDLISYVFISLARKPRIATPHHALGQLALTLKIPSLTSRAVAVHVFGQNRAISDKILMILPTSLRRAAMYMLRPLLSRLYIGMCFVHSDDSTPITLSREAAGLVARGYKGRAQKQLYWKLLWQFARRVHVLRLLPVPFVGGLTLPGSSVHYGASAPMGGSGPLACDANGQLRNAPGVFVADAASLPDIPAGSYTLSIMANALRIGRAAAG